MLPKEIHRVIPNKDTGIILVDSVPNNWSCVSGRLWVPRQIQGTQGVALTEGLYFGVQENEHLIPDNEHINFVRYTQVPYSAGRQVRLPYCVRFSLAGTEGSSLSLETVKQIISAYLSCDYVGNLHFINYVNRSERYSYFDRCSMYFEPFPRFSGDSFVSDSSHIYVGGNESRIQSITEVCHDLPPFDPFLLKSSRFFPEKKQED